MNRLDEQAEVYLSQGSNTQTPDDKNGFFLRDDVPKPFFANFLNDYSNIFNTDCDFEFTDSDYYAFPEYPNDPGDNWPDIPVDQMQNIPNEAERTFNAGNYMSLDQITTIFSGLRCVYDLVDDDLVQPTASDSPLNLRLESKNIVHRILDYIVHEETCPGNDPCFSFQIKDLDGRTFRAGSDLSVASPFIFSIGRHFNYPIFNDWVNDGLSNVRVAFMMDSPELMDIIDDLNWNGIIAMGELLPAQITQLFNIDPSDFDLPVSVNYPCIGNLIDRLEEKGNEPINIGTIPLSQLLILIDEFQEQNIEIISANSEICVSLTTELLQAIVDLEIDVQGFYCDNIGLGIAKVLAAIAASHLLAASSLLTSVAALAWIAEVNQEPSFCIQTANNNSLSEDNVHIIQELATISERLSAEYVHSIAEPSGLDYYTMLRTVLDPSSNVINLLSFEHYKNDFINTAPCGGTWGKPETGGDFQNPLFCSGNDWASRNRLFHAQDRQFGANTPEFRGEYSGLDYMLYYNLYHLLWPNLLPSYQRNISCRCVEEITYDEEIWEQLNVNRKFDDYQAKGIPIESYLAHNLNVSSSTGVLNVKNDLIICREYPNVPTTLTIEQGGTLNLHSENTITVRSGNKIHITSGAMMQAGINEIATDMKAAIIILEENAELIVDDEASIQCFGGLHLVMKEGSKFILNDSECVPFSSAYNGITFQTDQAEIHITESQLCSSNNSDDVSSNFVQTDFTSNNSLIRFERNLSAVYEATATESSFIFTGNSRLNLSMPFVHSLGEVEFWDDTKLIIDDGVLTIGDQVTMLWRSHDCRIIHEDAHLVFDGGKLNIPANHTFTFTYPNAGSGYVEVMPGTENMLLTGNGSIFKLIGESNEDVVLKINEGAHIQNSVFHAGNFLLQDCKVDCEGSIFTDMEFQASNVTFDGSGSIANWSSHPIYHNCIFNQMFISTYWCKLLIENCQSDHSHFYAEGGSYFLHNNDFMMSKMSSEKLQSVSLILACNFSNDDGDIPYLFDEYQFIDSSLVEVKFTNCTFNGLNKCNGAYKVGGTLSLSCCLFDQCPNALFIHKGTVLNMSTNSFAGNNQFTSCDIMVHCQDAFNVLIDRGYNDFSDVGTCILSGNLITYICDFTIDGCILPELPANYNIWPQGGDAPGWPMMDLHAINVAGCSPSQNCPMTIVDGAPIESFQCALTKPITEVTKSLIEASQGGIPIITKYAHEQSPSSNNHGWLKDVNVGNPLITTFSFDHVELEEALITAANFLEIIDTAGNDSIAIGLFHEILTCGLDRSNGDIRWKMTWGLRHMKSAMENRFVQNEITPEQNSSVFHPDIQKYVDVLNVMTDENVSDTTYKEQFYFELDKGQFFRTIGKSNMAYELFDRLDDCQLDSLEQDVLNLWLEAVAIELSVFNQYANGISLDAISFIIDTTGFSVPEPYIANEYYFGAIINSPISVSYVPCGFSYKNKTVANNPLSFEVFPNPASDIVHIQYGGEEQMMKLSIVDVTGKTIFHTTKYLLRGELWTLDLPGVAAGSYLVLLAGKKGKEQTRIVFE